MSIKVELKHETTGDSRTVKAGWSWTCFFFGSLLGIPYFMRKLPLFGAIGVILFILSILLAFSSLNVLVQAATLAFAVFGGLMANRLTYENYKKLGYVIKDDETSPNVIALVQNRYSAAELVLGALVVALWVGWIVMMGSMGRFY